MQSIFSEFGAVFLEFRDKVINANEPTFVTREKWKFSSQLQFSTLRQASQIITNSHADTSLSNPSKQTQERIDAKDNGATSTPIADSQQQIEVSNDEDSYSESSFISEDKETEH